MGSLPDPGFRSQEQSLAKAERSVLSVLSFFFSSHPISFPFSPLAVPLCYISVCPFFCISLSPCPSLSPCILSQSRESVHLQGKEGGSRTPCYPCLFTGVPRPAAGQSGKPAYCWLGPTGRLPEREGGCFSRGVTLTAGLQPSRKPSKPPPRTCAVIARGTTGCFADSKEMISA